MTSENVRKSNEARRSIVSDFSEKTRESIVKMSNRVKSMTKAKKPRPDFPSIRMKGFLEQLRKEDGFESKFERRRVFGVLILTIIVVCFVGAAIYSEVEEWGYFDSFYYIIITLLTVGYGDFYPTETGTKILTIFFILASLSFTTTLVVVLEETLIQRHQQKMLDLVDQTSDDHKNNEIDTIQEQERTVISSEQSEVVNDPQNNDNSITNQKVVTTTTTTSNDSGFKSILPHLFASLFIFSIGVIFGCVNEEMGVLDSIYFCSVTASTVGYGDITPEKQNSRVFYLFFVIIMVPMTALLVAKIAAVWVSNQQSKALRVVLEKFFDEDMIDEMDADKSGEVTEQEFIEFWLVRMGKVRAEDIQELKRRFTELDVDGSGVLDRDDLIKMGDR